MTFASHVQSADIVRYLEPEVLIVLVISVMLLNVTSLQTQSPI